MNSTFNELILNQDIQTLPLSDEFKRMAAANGFRKLDEMLSFRLSFLLKQDGFTPEVQQEFTVYLQEQELWNLLKQY